jgi:hypothetical protein
MAVVLGQTYPELFAGVGAHSGLPYASAHDVASAMAAMKGGRSSLPGLQRMAGAATQPRKKSRQAVPTVVFHGDRDHTVQHANGAAIAQQAQAAHAAGAESGRASKLHSSTHSGIGAGGRRPALHAHGAPGQGWPALHRDLDPARRGPRLVGRRRQQLVHRRQRPRHLGRDAALLHGAARNAGTALA